MAPLHVAVLANLKKNAPRLPGIPEDYWADLDSEHTVEAIADALRQGGHSVTVLEGDLTLYDRLREVRPDICFNICEGHFGDSREAHVPAILEMMRVPYTGSKVLTLALTLDKPMTKRVLAFHGLPTPPFQVFERADEPLDPELVFPLFVKPSRQGTGMGISAQSVVRDTSELRVQVGQLLDAYQEPVLVERFVAGRDITVGVVGNLVPPVAWRVPEDEEAPRIHRGLRFLPPLEIELGTYALEEGGVYTYRAKVELAEKLHYICPAQLDPDLVEELNWLAAATFRVTGCLDVARVDFRLDEADGDEPYILEINPLPGLAPEISDLVIEGKAAGLGHVELVNMILDEALVRYPELA
jgi:D-alanine-D-alanine ligase